MRRLLSLALLGFLVQPLAAQEATPNTLSDSEKTEGWKLLFDGKSLKGWRAYRGQPAGDKWKVVDGTLTFKPREGKRGGDLVTEDEFANFDLRFDWKVQPGANSGVMYRVSEAESAPYFTGPEYQILDNTRHPDGRSKLTSAASCYALYAPTEDVTKPVGEWNQSRIVLRGNQLEHWLNGKKVVSVEIGSDDWNKKVAGSKFKDWKKFGTMSKGRIDFQDHGDEVSFRNIKILRLDDK